MKTINSLIFILYFQTRKKNITSCIVKYFLLGPSCILVFLFIGNYDCYKQELFENNCSRNRTIQ